MMDDLNFSYLGPIYHSRTTEFFHYFFSLLQFHQTQKFQVVFSISLDQLKMILCQPSKITLCCVMVMDLIQRHLIHY